MIAQFRAAIVTVFFVNCVFSTGVFAVEPMNFYTLLRCASHGLGYEAREKNIIESLDLIQADATTFGPPVMINAQLLGEPDDKIYSKYWLVDKDGAFKVSIPKHLPDSYILNVPNSLVSPTTGVNPVGHVVDIGDKRVFIDGSGKITRLTTKKVGSFEKVIGLTKVEKTPGSLSDLERELEVVLLNSNQDLPRQVEEAQIKTNLRFHRLIKEFSAQEARKFIQASQSRSEFSYRQTSAVSDALVERQMEKLAENGNLDRFTAKFGEALNKELGLALKRGAQKLTFDLDDKTVSDLMKTLGLETQEQFSQKNIDPLERKLKGLPLETSEVRNDLKTKYVDEKTKGRVDVWNESHKSRLSEQVGNLRVEQSKLLTLNDAKKILTASFNYGQVRNFLNRTEVNGLRGFIEYCSGLPDAEMQLRWASLSADALRTLSEKTTAFSAKGFVNQSKLPDSENLH